MRKRIIILIVCTECCLTFHLGAQESLLTPFRLSLPSGSLNIEYIDLDKDGDPDVLRSTTYNNIPVQWIDDDDDMRQGDLEGDMDSDCLMVDRNKDGQYGGPLDLIIDWNDENADGKPDMQVVADNGELNDRGRFKSHYMWIIDADHDQIFNYIDWNTFQIEAWDHTGRCLFFEDYIGHSIMLKSHTSTFNISDLRYSWENPFLFFDEDHDGLTEMTIRLTDEPEMNKDAKPLPPDGNISEEMRSIHFDGRINSAYISIDLDNDNGPSSELDYDFSLKFSGKGFDYSDQKHTYESIKGLPGSEKYFYDARWRNMNELIYAGHDTAYALIFQRGEWESCWFTYDEDDDCQRWERVELYQPGDPFKVGSRAGGVDSNPQSDVSGDRGEWDQDFSGCGNLYLGPFDGRLHLYGAEHGCWRIDQESRYFQGWQGWRGLNLQPQDLQDKEPEIFPTIEYYDKSNNGFFDIIKYDLDGDQQFEKIVSLDSMGISDTAQLIYTARMSYEDFHKLYKETATQLWNNALNAVETARRKGLNTGWYTSMMHPRSLREKYHYGYWLNFYIYLDLIQMGVITEDESFLRQLDKAYYSQNWSMLQ